MQSLKTRVTVFTLAIFLIGLWSLSFYVSRMLREDMQRQLGEQQFATVSIIAAGVGEELTERLSALEKVARDITPVILGDTAALQAWLEQRGVFQGLFNGGTFATRLDGIATASVPLSAQRRGVGYRDRAHIAAALDEGKSAIGKPVIGKALHTPAMAMSVPIRDGQGKVIGALSGVIDLGKPNFLDKVVAARYGKGGAFLIASRQERTIIASTDKSRILEVLPAPGINPAIDRAIRGEEGSFVFVDPLGIEQVAAVKGIPIAQWYLATELPAAEAFVPIQDLQRRMLGTTLVLTLVAGTVTWLMLKYQLSPMTAAAKALARQIETGRPSRPLPVARQDEVGDLVGGFNRLLNALGQHEEALRESEEKYRLLIDESSDPIFTYYPDGRYRYVNRAFADRVGKAPEEIMEKTVWDVFSREEADKRIPIIRGVFESGLGREVEVRVPRPDGDHYYLTTLKPLFNEQRQVISVIGNSKEITALKRAEAERARLETQLLESQKMEALGTLAGGVAHDFNNALTMIAGNVELAREDLGPGHAALKSLEEIAKASRRARDLVQQILAFGRRQPMQRKANSLALVVVEAARLLRAGLPAAVSLNVDCSGDAPPVLADATQVTQVVLNLCSNAAHAVQDTGRAGAIDVRLYAHSQSEPRESLPKGHYACLEVRDNGKGMDDAIRSRIFEPFFTTKPVGKGTGLGLSVVYGIVQAHGATIEVESAPGEGSTFRIFFPATDMPVATLADEGAKAGSAAQRAPHVLYVDDEVAIIYLMKRLLERRGFRVTGYTDPQEALAAARADPGQFDLVITDYRMPGMTGLEVASALKEIRPDLPVVMASGYISEELRAKAPAAGIRELVYKPNTVEELCDAVLRVARTIA